MSSTTAMTCALRILAIMRRSQSGEFDTMRFRALAYVFARAMSPLTDGQLLPTID
jgi:hypothetical protein